MMKFDTRAPFPSLMRAAVLSSCIFAVIHSWGCTSGIEPVLKLARSAATFVSVSDPILRGVYEAEQRACFTKPKEEQDNCFTTVRAKWAPVKDGLRDIRAAWCEFEPSKCPAGK